jgi:hypothetical protein
MVAVYMAKEHRVDLAQPRIAATAHRAPDVVENSGAVRILENQRAIEWTELPIMAAQPGDFHDATHIARIAGGAPREQEASENCK